MLILDLTQANGLKDSEEGRALVQYGLAGERLFNAVMGSGGSQVSDGVLVAGQRSHGASAIEKAQGQKGTAGDNPGILRL